MNQLDQVSIPYWTRIRFVPLDTGILRTRPPDLPQVVDVFKLVAGDLLLVGGASVVGVLEGVEMRVGVEPTEEVGGT